MAAELDVARPGGGLGSEAGDRLAFDKALYDGADHAGPQLRPSDSEARYWSSAWPAELFVEDDASNLRTGPPSGFDLIVLDVLLPDKDGVAVWWFARNCATTL